MVKRVKCQMKKNNFWTILFLKTNYIACSNEKIGRNGLIKKKCSCIGMHNKIEKCKSLECMIPYEIHKIMHRNALHVYMYKSLECMKPYLIVFLMLKWLYDIIYVLC